MFYMYSSYSDYGIGWSAKAGCTMWRQLFLKLHEEEVKTKIHFTDNWHHNFPIPNPTKPPHQFIPFDHIVVCRNPYCRLVSAFTNKVCKYHSQPNLYQKIPMEKVSFRCFVQGLHKLVKKKHVKLSDIDIHLYPQSDNYREYGYTYIVKLEEFDQKIIDVYKKLRLTRFIPKIEEFLKDVKESKIGVNKTDKITDEKYQYPVCDKEYDLVCSIFPDYKYFYDNELFEMVYDLYKEDFEAFGYEKYKI